jgi:hypothetical protein
MSSGSRRHRLAAESHGESALRWPWKAGHNQGGCPSGDAELRVELAVEWSNCTCLGCASGIEIDSSVNPHGEIA